MITPPSNDDYKIFAWATSDGEGGYHLKLYENNEDYKSQWEANSWGQQYGRKFEDWVEPLYKKTAKKSPSSGIYSEMDTESLREKVFWENGAFIGYLERDVDGYYYFSFGGAGFWNSTGIRWVASYLDNRNKDWDDQVRKDLGGEND